MLSRYFVYRLLSTLLVLSIAQLPGWTAPVAQQAAPAAATAQKPEIIEWVYRVQYGHRDEWFQIFKKFQLAILERQKQLGYVKEYSVWSPSLHTSEDSRWDYRVVITRASHDAPTGQSEEEIAHQLFPDQATFRREENRRWELTTNHWDLPIHEVNLKEDE